MKRSRLSCYLAVGLLLAGCANEPDGPDQRTATGPDDRRRDLTLDEVPSRGDDVAPGDDMAQGKNPELGPGLRRLAELAKQDLAARLGVDPSSVEVLTAEYVVWRDSGLGCPKPGDQAMQVLTNGARAKLRAGKQVYWYHSGENRPPFLCETPSAVEPLPYEPGEA